MRKRYEIREHKYERHKTFVHSFWVNDQQYRLKTFEFIPVYRPTAIYYFLQCDVGYT
jgi:hypothetical protein